MLAASEVRCPWGGSSCQAHRPARRHRTEGHRNSHSQHRGRTCLLPEGTPLPRTCRRRSSDLCIACSACKQHHLRAPPRSSRRRLRSACPPDDSPSGCRTSHTSRPRRHKRDHRGWAGRHRPCSTPYRDTRCSSVQPRSARSRHRGRPARTSQRPSMESLRPATTRRPRRRWSNRPRQACRRTRLRGRVKPQGPPRKSVARSTSKSKREVTHPGDDDPWCSQAQDHSSRSLHVQERRPTTTATCDGAEPPRQRRASRSAALDLILLELPDRWIGSG
jgi:hypothetical protein